MDNNSTLRDRYLTDALPVRLGGIASNLAKVGSYSRTVDNPDIVFRLLNETKWFIEWTAAEAEIDDAAQLVELQLELSRFQSDWGRIWANHAMRAAVATHSKSWSDRILKMSGLLD